MIKVAKFGGSSVAGAEQFAKVRHIIEEDPDRRVVVVSAAGKRSADDHKLTDLLYLCHAHLTYGVSSSFATRCSFSLTSEPSWTLCGSVSTGICRSIISSRAANTSPRGSWRNIWAIPL